MILVRQCVGRLAMPAVSFFFFFAAQANEGLIYVTTNGTYHTQGSDGAALGLPPSSSLRRLVPHCRQEEEEAGKEEDKAIRMKIYITSRECLVPFERENLLNMICD